MGRRRGIRGQTQARSVIWRILSRGQSSHSGSTSQPVTATASFDANRNTLLSRKPRVVGARGRRAVGRANSMMIGGSENCLPGFLRGTNAYFERHGDPGCLGTSSSRSRAAC